jgi:O-antigen/teichoic acid export membrane protein
MSLSAFWSEVVQSRTSRQLWYVPLLVGAMGIMMARLLIMARILSVPEFAQLSGGLLVASTFYMLGCLGLQLLLQRQWPVDIVRKRERAGIVLAAQCNLVALACAVVGVALAAAGLSVAGMSSALLAWGITHGFSQQLFVIATVESRSRGDALRYARENVVRSVIAVSAGVAAAIWTGSALWTLAAEAIVSVMLSWALFRRSAALASVRLTDVYALAGRHITRVDWMSALTLVVVGALSFTMVNADRWIAADRLDAHGFGAYSFAWIILAIAQSVQAVISASLYPLLARRFASHGRRAAFRVCVLSSLGMLIVGLVCIVPVWFALAWAIGHWFRVYYAATDLLPVFLIVAVLRVSDFWSSYLLVIGCEGRLLASNLIVTVVGVIAWLAWTHPWASRLQLKQVALLAVILATLSYAAAAGFAWRAKTSDARVQAH